MSQSITHRHRGRRIGEEWLVKYDDTESYIPDVTEVRKEREYKYKHKHYKQALVYLVNWIISMLLNSLIPLFAFQISLLQWKVYIKSLPPLSSLSLYRRWLMRYSWLYYHSINIVLCLILLEMMVDHVLAVGNWDKDQGHSSFILVINLGTHIVCTLWDTWYRHTYPS